MSALVLATLIAAAPDPAADPDDLSELARLADDDLDAGVDPTLVDASLVDPEGESIEARLRRVRARRPRASLWPRLAVTVSFGSGTRPSLDRTAGSAPRGREAGTQGLVWSILATWDGP